MTYPVVMVKSATTGRRRTNLWLAIECLGVMLSLSKICAYIYREISRDYGNEKVDNSLLYLSTLVCLTDVKWFFKKYFLNFHIITIKKLINKKYILLKKKLTLFLKKCYLLILGVVFFSINYKKFKNIKLFTDYNKFDPSIFNYYIFCFESFFLFNFTS